MPRRSLFPILLATLLLPALATPQDVPDLARQFLERRDDTPEEVVEELARAGTRAAFEALREGYDGLSSVFARRRVLRLLPGFDGVVDAEQAALQLLTDVATGSPEAELRSEAVRAIGRFEGLGKGFLQLIVDSPAVASVREQAMELHVRLGGEEDLEWYRRQWLRTSDVVDEEVEAARREHRKLRDPEAELVLPPRANLTVRRLAFERLLRDLGTEVLEESATEDRDPEVRSLSLAELARRGGRGVEKVARDRFKRIDEWPVVRVAAAEALERLLGGDVVKDFLDMADKRTTPDVLRTRMAEMALPHVRDDAKVRKLLLRRLGKGGFEEQRFVLLALRQVGDEDVSEALLELIEEGDEPRLRLLALDLVAERREQEAVPVVQGLLDDEETGRRLREAAFRTMGDLRRGDPAWREEVRRQVDSPDRDLRNAALTQLGPEELDLVLGALRHEDWSTRHTALERIVAFRDPSTIGPLVERLGQESGRMEQEVAGALWELTGQPFGARASAWEAWWEAEGQGFVPPTAEEVARLEDERRERELRQTTRAPEFFGVRILSERVVFVLDVSGSMAWELGGEGEERGEPIRIDIAKQELLRTLEALPPEALFNLIVFSGGVSAWNAGGVFASTEKSRQEAVEFVERLGVGGGTNIHAALRAAFADPEADTIVFLSDGEPSVGAVVDPQLLREEVAAWNADRGIVLHTIALGGQLDLLEWLAEDSGGSHVRYE